MGLTDEERKKCISRTLKGTFYVGMALIKHDIKNIIREKEGYIIFKGELWLKHLMSRTEIHIKINSDKPNKSNPKRCYGYIYEVWIKELGEEEFIKSSGYDIRELVKYGK